MFLLANDLLCVLIASEPEKDRLPKLIAICPLGKFDLGDRHRLDPGTALHDRGGDSQSPSSGFSFWQIHKGSSRKPDLLQTAVQHCQGFFRETGPDPAREQEPVLAVVADQQSSEVFAAAFGRRVPADHELLLLVSLTLTQAPLRRPAS